MKKGSLSLSVNAIVILIIAITMLGLGLGFVKSLFGGAMDKFGALVEDEQDPSPPSGSDPVSLSRGIVTSGPGQSTAIKIALYNPTSGPWTDVQPDIECSGDAAFDTMETINSKTIQQGKYEVFGVLLDVPSVPATTELCEIKFTAASGGPISYTEDFTIKVEQ